MKCAASFSVHPIPNTSGYSHKVLPDVFNHMSNSRECMGDNGEALQLHTVYKKPYSFTTSYARIRIRYYKSHALHLNAQ